MIEKFAKSFLGQRISAIQDKIQVGIAEFKASSSPKLSSENPDHYSPKWLTERIGKSIIPSSDKKTLELQFQSTRSRMPGSKSIQELAHDVDRVKIFFEGVSNEDELRARLDMHRRVRVGRVRQNILKQKEYMYPDQEFTTNNTVGKALEQATGILMMEQIIATAKSHHPYI